MPALRWRRFRRKAPADRQDPATAFYRRLLGVLARHLGARPQGGQTPSEFAAAAGQRLRAAPATAALAGLPADTAVYYYRVRYGRRPLNDAERRSLDGQLDCLEAAFIGTASSS